MAESYQNNSSCRSNKSIQEPTLQRQPTAAGEKKKKKTQGGGEKGKIVNSHQDISFQVNGAHQRRIAFPPAVRGGAPYAVPPFPKFRRIIKCYGDFKQCLCACYPAGTQLTWNWGLAVQFGTPTRIRGVEGLVNGNISVKRQNNHQS